MQFTPTEARILKLVQGNIPDSATPFADIAASVNEQLNPRPPVREEDVLALLHRLREARAIRRFGATLRHQKAGFSANAMVAWRVPAADVDRLGPLLAEDAQVSHCYHRPTTHPDWPYNLYTMLHGRSQAECLEAVARLGGVSGLTDYHILFSIRELKKTSMRYF